MCDFIYVSYIPQLYPPWVHAFTGEVVSPGTYLPTYYFISLHSMCLSHLVRAAYMNTLWNIPRLLVFRSSPNS